ncbi:MAG: hypothetical protein KDA77_24415, partial [Planctomycetaceae bacterium]|nr:hypothetical protein [Planctomycetaceae bacterium]
PKNDLPKSVTDYLLSGEVLPERPEVGSNGEIQPTINREPGENLLNGRERPDLPLSDNLPTSNGSPLDLSDNDRKPEPLLQSVTSPDLTMSDLSLSDKIFRKDPVAVLMTAILVMTDSFSCGWLAYSGFEKFWPAVFFFSLVGFAVAYASIRNAIMYTGWESDTWLWSFGILQLLLHAAAFKLLG